MATQKVAEEGSDKMTTTKSWAFLQTDADEDMLGTFAEFVEDILNTRESGGVDMDEFNKINAEVNEPFHASIIPGMEADIEAENVTDILADLWESSPLFDETHYDESMEMTLTVDELTVYPNMDDPECVILRFEESDDEKLRSLRTDTMEHIRQADTETDLLYTESNAYDHLTPHVTIGKFPFDMESSFNESQRAMFNVLAEHVESTELTFSPNHKRWE